LSFQYENNRLKVGLKKHDLMDMAEKLSGAPFYVYDLDGMNEKIHALQKAFQNQISIHYAMKANSNRRLLGFFAEQNIGVDVEHIQELPNMTTMARTNFSKSEQETLFSLPKSQQRLAFFTCWTRKEAYIKAVGDGFALPLRSFDVTFLPDDPPCILRAIGDDPQNWQLYDVSRDDAYVGAVCIQSKERDNLRLLDFHERR